MFGKADQRQFEAYLREHLGIVLKVAGIYAGGHDARDDLAQEICAQAWRAFSRYDERRAKFSTWLYRVSLNVAISHARGVRRSGRRYLEPLDDVYLETVAGSGSGQLEWMEHDERLRTLHALIARLDGLNRALILLYLEDRSYAEIAGVLGISEANVATKINRIKQKLRADMTATPITGA